MHIKCVLDLFCKGKGQGSCQDDRQSGRLSQTWCMVARSSKIKFYVTSKIKFYVTVFLLQLLCSS